METGVDFEERTIRGMVVAEEGEFDDGRGSFDREALEKIVELGNREVHGLKCHMSHGEKGRDRTLDLLGRARRFRIDEADGKALVRADLKILDAIPEDKATFVLGLANEDPTAAGASLVLAHRRTREGVFRPEFLKAVDIVDDGAATSSLLHSCLSVQGDDLDAGVWPESVQEQLSPTLDADAEIGWPENK